MGTSIFPVNISRAIRLSSVLMTCLIFLAGCAVLPPFISPPPERVMEEGGIAHLGSTSRKIIFTVDFEKKDNARELLFFVPPARAISIEFLDIDFISVDEGGAAPNKPLPDRSKLYELAKNYVRIEDIGYMRFNRMVRVMVTRTLSLSNDRIDIKRLKAALVFESYSPKGAVKDSSLRQTSSGFGKIAQNIIINYCDFARYTDPSPPFDLQISQSGWSEFCNTTLNSKQDTLHKISIPKAGIYGIDSEYLNANGINPDTIHPRDITLYHQGEQVPFIVVGGFAERFTPADKIIFYAGPSHSTFTIENSYWLQTTLQKRAPPRLSLWKKQNMSLPIR